MSLPRIALLAATTALFSLSACAQYGSTATPSNNASSQIHSSTEDPDGDGNVKGIAHFSKIRPATGNKIFIFDPQYHAWAVYDAEGHRINIGNASGGKVYCRDINRSCKTVVGTFKVIRIGGANCKSSRYPIETHGGAPMPYCMYFSPKGYAIHASNQLPNDENASHGCIRVSPLSAKWLNQHFMTVGTTVIVLPYGTK